MTASQAAGVQLNWKQSMPLSSIPMKTQLHASDMQRQEQLKKWVKAAAEDIVYAHKTHESDLGSNTASDRETVAASTLTQLYPPARESSLDSLLCAQELIEMREKEDSGSNTSASGDTADEPRSPLHHPVQPDLPLRNLQQLQLLQSLQLQSLQQQANAVTAKPFIGVSLTPSPLDQVALIDLHMKNMLHDYAMRRASLLAGAGPQATPAPAPVPVTVKVPVAAPTPVPPPKPAAPKPAPFSSASTSVVNSADGGQEEMQLNWKCGMTIGATMITPKQREEKFWDEKLLAKRDRPDEPWIVKSWAIQGRRPYMKRVELGDGRARWKTKRPRTDTTSAPSRPSNVHMVCLASNDSKDGGCGCWQTSEAILEHNGLDSIGEWHVVTQPHFNCPRGSFRPAVFCTACDSTCRCACHMNEAIDPAKCKCKGTWERASAEEWVKTTTAPTANGWKDKRSQHKAAKAARSAAKAAAV